jgi:hypothetical protein
VYKKIYSSIHGSTSKSIIKISLPVDTWSTDSSIEMLIKQGEAQPKLLEGPASLHLVQNQLSCIYKNEILGAMYICNPPKLFTLHGNPSS